VTRVLVTGGAGYVGSRLVPKLLAAGHEVTVLDLYIYGEVLAAHPGLTEVKGDLRDLAAVERALLGCDAVVHLACISNDPSFDLDPALGRSINYDSFRPLVRAARRAGVRRFVNASTSSVYGLKSTPDVTEDLPLEPLTDYSRFKALCEQILAEERAPGFVTVTLRPATVCGWAPRLRLDLSVNILTNHAINRRVITVFGGEQLRPNIHIDDVTDAYLALLAAPDDKIDGQVFNAGYQNHSIRELADVVRRVVGEDVEIRREPTPDLRSYHISSARIARELGFTATRTIEDAVRDLSAAFAGGLVPRPDDDRYHNIRRMKALGLR
jgi:nucleoside-diphosphate-sugar epimerase